MKLKNLFFIAFILLASQVKAQQPTLLPQFKFFKLNGKPFSNKDLVQGKKNLFILFDCTCDHCQRETKVLNENYAKFKNVNIYMITLDEAYIIPQFFDSYAKGLNAKPNVTVLQDKNQIFIPTFMPKMYPAMYLYSPNAKLLLYHAGDGSIKQLIKTIGK